MCVDDGWDEPQDKRYPPNDRPEIHSHDFDATVRISSGELHMVYANRVDVLGPGDHCIVPAGTMHSEQTGPGGAEGHLAVRQIS